MVREVCRPAYRDSGAGGRPGVDPAVFLKMLMIGFFENLPSERAIASFCEDSLSLRAFPGYDLTESTPDHSSLSVIRARLGKEVYQSALEIVLKALLEHNLLKGRHFGLDSFIIEANASIRELQHRNTEEDYWSYVKKHAAEAGFDPDDTKAVRRFDKKRQGRKNSNEDWIIPHDPEARVGRTKDGACDMVYKPEHLSDLDTGAIIRVEVRAGDAEDSEGLCERVMKGYETLARVCEDPQQEKVGKGLTIDKGYFSLEEVFVLQCEGIRTIIGDKESPSGWDRPYKVLIYSTLCRFLLTASTYSQTARFSFQELFMLSFIHTLRATPLRVLPACWSFLEATHRRLMVAESNRLSISKATSRGRRTSC